MLGEPARTPFDLNFVLFGFPIRVSGWFWLAGLLFGQGAASQGRTAVLGFIAAMFLSILIHELGHAFAFRRYGIDCHIVLYHFGGLAIPTRDRFGGGYAASVRNPWHDIIISAAGPFTQLLAALLLLVALIALPVSINQRFLESFVTYFWIVSVFWALLNLIPVYPLDGGQIARNLFLLFGGANAIPHSLVLSIVAGGGVALYGYSNGMPMLAIMFALLAFGSFQAYQAYQTYGGSGYDRG